MNAAASGAEPWPLRLFRRSVIKQEKWRQIVRLLPALEGLACLDIGADNGVISLLLRQRGGRWTSADLDETTVAAIRLLVGERVERIGGDRTPFAARSFDLIVIVDFLEHVHTDRAFARELTRILKPGGTLIVHVPHPKPGSWITRLRLAAGLTDEQHGHVRPGYTLAGLRETLGDGFALETSQTYSRAFSEAVDIALNAVYQRGRDTLGEGPRSAKGTVVTAADLERRRKQFLALSLVYPLLWLWVRLDHLLAGRSGHRLIARFRLSEGAGV